EESKSKEFLQISMVKVMAHIPKNRKSNKRFNTLNRKSAVILLRNDSNGYIVKKSSILNIIL
ncbi:MAG: hypothetical protein COW26_00240, partial [Nitrosopumilales archaeon CG15_BIG_FIL_POST_REV_8_21_14_020_33_23]